MAIETRRSMYLALNILRFPKPSPEKHLGFYEHLGQLTVNGIRPLALGCRGFGGACGRRVQVFECRLYFFIGCPRESKYQCKRDCRFL